MSFPPAKPEPSEMSFAEFVLDDEEPELPPIQDDDPVDYAGQAVNEKPLGDVLIHAEVMLPQGDNIKCVKVKG